MAKLLADLQIRRQTGPPVPSLPGGDADGEGTRDPGLRVQIPRGCPHVGHMPDIGRSGRQLADKRHRNGLIGSDTDRFERDVTSQVVPVPSPFIHPLAVRNRPARRTAS